MIQSRKIVWHEGMFIAPHHFQQFDHYQEGLLHFRLQALCEHGWGAAGLEIDGEALKNGVFTLRRCAGIMPDGLAVRIPETDPPPQSRSFEAFFQKAQGALAVYLAIPEEYAGAMNCRLASAPEPHATRYAGHTARVRDENTGENEREILYAHKQFKIIFAGEALQGLVYFKLAEIVQSPEQVFALNEKYIPPCLAYWPGSRLSAIAQDLTSILIEKQRSLSQARRQKNPAMVEFGALDVMNFWLLHAVNTVLPLFIHLQRQEYVHPEKLYRIMAQLAGALTTFAVDLKPQDVPAYVHADLSATFEPLYHLIRRLLEVVLPTKCAAIPLEPTLESWSIGRVAERRMFEKTHFYLAVRADVAEDLLIRDVPKTVKIGALDRIAMLVRRASPGVRLFHEPHPPAPIPVRSGYKYFRLEGQGNYWDEIRNTMALAIYFPDDLPGLHAELMAVWE